MSDSKSAWRRLLAATLLTLIAAVPLLVPGSAEVQSLATFLEPPSYRHRYELAAHFAVTSALTLVWWAAFRRRRMVRTAVIVGCFSVVTEFSQFAVDRGVSAYDLLANLSGVLVVLLFLRL